ncbi:hypothetical protein [Microbacterium album]|uniref:Minor tail protein n=1 Tax=Microbacterium album TaxID=2053191 RepID=A0A917ICE5_9MICO|nr:hypothetical protein [Microbacterium album]GGH34260.1 hypothetical protein GCM10010921_01830 [Microbacterium album]
MITSVGYAGTVSEVEWADLAWRAGGARYGVAGIDDWRATVAMGDRAVQISPGKGWGNGVVDTSDAPEVLTAAPVASGTRYDLLVARRDWQTRQTTFAIVQGSAERAIPARATDVGIVDEQPLWLLRVVAGQSQVQEIIDVRVIPGDGGMLAFDQLALSYLGLLGTVVRIGDVVWSRVLNAVGTPTWRSAPSPDTDTGWVTLTPQNQAWSVAAQYGYQALAVRRIGFSTDLSGIIRNATQRVQAGFVGAHVPAGSRPRARTLLTCHIAGVEAVVEPNGRLLFARADLAPGTPIPLAGHWISES